ncbi:ABC transporter substrate-binding protein [Nonomuraea sediminis]|uniref:ABC transporter substrate-binding protein n=1 Tax=Nonomuraea sediminis TaxID=2835864 RepID=UPI001BDC6DA8|nr:ABC transporter substrate-binding protein [Nonomuraea sediminis]
MNARTGLRTRITITTVGTVAVMATLAGCGSGEKSSSATTAPVAADASLAAKVPSTIRSAGKIVVGTDATYAPSEFLDTDGKTVVGFDVEIFDAAAAKLGLKTEWHPAKFTDIIPGVQSTKYNIGVSSFSATPERMKTLNMVTYFSAGTRWAQRPESAIDPDNACGKKIAVQVGTVSLDDATARSKKCAASGKPAIAIDQFQAQSDATAAVVSGKDDAMIADATVTAYAVKQANGKLAFAGQEYDAALYAYVLPKDQTEFAGAIQAAVQEIIADGTYRKILTKWGVEAGSITNPAVNPSA